MSAVNTKLGQTLFPFLAAALLFSACSDSTGPRDPSTHGDPVEDLPTTPAPNVGPPTLGDTAARPNDVIPTSGPPSGGPAASLQLSVAGASSLEGDLSPCQWYGNYCYRSLNVGYGEQYPVYLVAEFNRDGGGDYVYLWIWDWGVGRYQEWYAVGRSDLSVWWKYYNQWILYQPGSVQTGPTTVVINPQGQCGIEQLCTLGLLDKERVLANGFNVAFMLTQIVTGT